MKNLENVKALNDMEMAKVAGGNFFADLEDVLRNIFAEDAKSNRCFLEKANGCFLVKPPKTSDEAPLTRRGKC